MCRGVVNYVILSEVERSQGHTMHEILLRPWRTSRCRIWIPDLPVGPAYRQAGMFGMTDRYNLNNITNLRAL
jgi:hypothetical protein